MKTLNEIAENYFNTLNPIAQRISTDILTVKEAYEDLWYSLSEKERNQIINETVVHPEALLKYALNSNSSDGIVDGPLHTKVTGSKFVVDETTGIVWRDEHSAPFSWKTPSQINLSIFTATSDDLDRTDGSFIMTNAKAKPVQDSCQNDKTFDLKLESSNWEKSSTEKTDLDKNNLSPESNVVLVGTCSKLSGLCSKLKFLPSKSYSYEVQTVVANPTCSTDGSLLNRLKSTAVLKLQNTLKLIGGKGVPDKKLMDSKEMDNLLQQKGPATIIKVTKPSPKVSKPKSPPPPPPPLSSRPEIKSCDNKPQEDNSSEKATLLDKQSLQSFKLDDLPEAIHDNLSDINTSKTTSTIPKSGFDFLDNWIIMGYTLVFSSWVGRPDMSQ